MMKNPEYYAVQWKDAAYPELMAERDRLLYFIRDYEEKEKAGDRSGDEWLIHPQPDVLYQVYLEYLGVLCRLMQEKYNRDYVWGERSLRDDAKAQ